MPPHPLKGISSSENRSLALPDVSIVDSKVGSDCLIKAAFLSAPIFFAESKVQVETSPRKGLR